MKGNLGARVAASMAAIIGAGGGGASRPIGRALSKEVTKFGHNIMTGMRTNVAKKRNGGTQSGAAALKRAAKKRRNIRKNCKK